MLSAVACTPIHCRRGPTAQVFFCSRRRVHPGVGVDPFLIVPLGSSVVFFVFSTRLVEFITRKCKRHITQQVIEDSFNCVKTCVDRKSNSTATPQYAWSNLVDRQVLGDKYDFKEVERVPTLPGYGATFESSTFTPVLQRNRMSHDLKAAKLHELVGFAEPSWYSPGASNYLAAVADLEAARQAHEQGKLGMLGHWSYCRLVQKEMMIRRADDPDGPWLLGVGNADGALAIAWPAKPVDDGQYVADISSDRRLLCILDIDDWVAQPVRWKSPMSRAFVQEALRQGKTADDDDVVLKGGADYPLAQIVAFTTGPPQSLWRVAAAQGFFDLPQAFLREVCQRRGIDLHDATLLTTLESMYKDAFPDATTEDIIGMLERRGVCLQKTMTHVQDLCSMEELAGTFDRGFSEAMMAEIKEARQTESNFKDFDIELIRYKAQRLTTPLAPPLFCQSHKERFVFIKFSCVFDDHKLDVSVSRHGVYRLFLLVDVGTSFLPPPPSSGTLDSITH